MNNIYITIPQPQQIQFGDNKYYYDTNNIYHQETIPKTQSGTTYYIVAGSDNTIGYVTKKPFEREIKDGVKEPYYRLSYIQNGNLIERFVELIDGEVVIAQEIPPRDPVDYGPDIPQIPQNLKDRIDG